jgi:hypothetical protein
MTKGATATGTARLRLHVITAGLKERMLVRAALMDHDAQLKNFTPLRDRIVASGQDANAKYRELESERDRLLAEWKKLTPTDSPTRFPALPGSSALSLPIAALKLVGVGGLGPWFGYSGSVHMGPAQEGENQIPAGVSGLLDTLQNGRLPNGSVLFTGDLVTSDRAAIWLHNWTYLIVFPAPVVKSVLSYSFGVGVQESVIGGLGSATFLSFVSLGEVASVSNQGITVNNDGFPLVTNIASPIERGVLNVHRSFLVGAEDVPAVALVMGVATALSPGSEIMFSNGRDCFICPAATIDPTTAVGPDPERGIVNFHYQPLPPDALE